MDGGGGGGVGAFTRSMALARVVLVSAALTPSPAQRWASRSSRLRHVFARSPPVPPRQAVPIAVEAELQEAIARGDRRRLGNCIVHRRGDMLRLERAQEPGNIQSEWDAGMCCTPDYAGTMAEMARDALVSSQPQAGGRCVLMLGLGGGTIAGQLLLRGGLPDGSFDPLLHVTAVESDVDVARAASRYFMPLMFEQAAGAASLQRRLHILHADALGVVEGTVGLGEHGPFDVIIEDFACERASPRSDLASRDLDLRLRGPATLPRFLRRPPPPVAARPCVARVTSPTTPRRSEHRWLDSHRLVQTRAQACSEHPSGVLCESGWPRRRRPFSSTHSIMIARSTSDSRQICERRAGVTCSSGSIVACRRCRGRGVAG